MKKRFRYFIILYRVFIIMLLVAFISFKLSFAIFDTVNASTSANWEAFWESAKWMMIYAFALMPANLMFSYIKADTTKRIVTRMKTDYLSAVFEKNISEFQKDNNQQYVSAMTNDFNLIEKDYVEQIINIIEAIVNFLTAILIITLISPIILLIGLGIVVFNVIISALSSRPIKKHNKERSEMMGEYGGFIKEILSAFHIIKTNDLESRIVENYRDRSEKVQHKKYIIDKIMSYIYAIQNANFSLIFLVLMFVVSYLTIQGVILFAGVVVVAQNVDNIIGPVSQISEAVPRILSVKSIFTRIDQTLKNQYVHEETLSFDQLNTSIQLNHVSFAYNEENEILKDVNLNFEKGKKYLVIGPSGGGKSTLLRLLRKYFEPNEGQILIDDQNLNDIKKIDYFSKIANIEQQIFLFEDTLRNNLTLYKDYSDEEIYDAIKRAGLEHFVKQHPDGLNRLILDNGKNISGGEKSRVAIARGLLNHAEIILLDEAFASLDPKSAIAIEASLLALKNVTVINVSHVILEENKSSYDDIVMVKNKKAVLMST
ncbi:ABC transporter ATP-binding protein [Peloplasma aerotolerans]|jgi:ATP-binding cassette, subfamily B, bacterial|uniref:ABC transporter ATP-binding protein n=1 Tax=Peloplasma aerotolerans TaxID=3044389 RepID=A0AAW6UDF2_9MOLU|nr:ABC transporter ATP-binding protein [Mariniplasma sp. M4Ah]MDI6453013.1 ABC transporter ATP-binding protein [Mariniplasma sp. M4Ah]